VVSLPCIFGGRHGAGHECGYIYLCGTHLVLCFSGDDPSNGVSMWVAPKCRAKAMPVVDANNDDTLWSHCQAEEHKDPYAPRATSLAEEHK
jgi:hypothetical protein